jgi:hypothetical protein
MYVQDEDRDGDAPEYSYFRSGHLVFRSSILPILLFQALDDIHPLVSRRVKDFLCLHAGVVAGRDGALVLPAPAEGGKSTLVAGLLREGFRYLSDELGAIDPITSQVYPFPKRVHLDPGALRYLPDLENQLNDRHGLTARITRRFLRPEDVGTQVAGPQPVRWIAFISDDRTGPPRLIPVSRAAAVERLAGNCFNLDVYRERGVVLLSRAAAEAEAFLLEGGSPEERAALLAEQFLWR